MKSIRWLILVIVILSLPACQPQAGVRVTILDRDQVYRLTSREYLPSSWLAEAGLTLGPKDSLLYLGTSTSVDVTLTPAESYTLTIRRAVKITVVTPDGEQILQSSAPTIGQ